jgi:hypothetical protein
MSQHDNHLASRAPSASSALLTAALTGLLCLSSACSPNPPSGNDAAADASPAQDAAPDATQAEDASDATAPIEASAPDVNELPDSTVSPDSATSSDGGASMMDASSPSDVVRPDPEAGCDVVPDRVITATDAAFGFTLESFTALCDRAGGYVEVHPHCGGANSCKGFSYDEGVHVWTEHTCAGLNTCNGFSCVIP